MGFSLRIGSMLVTADTAAEAADLVRALGEVMPEPVKRPQGSGEIIETPSGWKIRARVAGERVSRAGFKSRGEAEAALVVLVDTGVAPPLKRHRRPKPPANDTTPAPPALPAPAPAPPAPPALQKGTPEWRARVAEALRASWSRRRSAAAGQTAPDPGASGCAASDEDGKHEAFDNQPPELLPAAGNITCDDEGTDLTDLVDVPDAEPTVFPDLDLGTECHGCGQRGHQMGSSLCPLSTKGEHIEPAQKKRPATTEEWASWRAENPARRTLGSAFTETEREMRRQLAVVDPDQGPIDADRPRTRADCEGLPRPCPWISCRYHLAIDVNELGTLHRTFGLTDVSEMHETCALDIADRGGATLEEIGRALNVSRERIRQLETLALANAARSARRLHLAVEFPDEPRSNAPEDAL